MQLAIEGTDPDLLCRDESRYLIAGLPDQLRNLFVEHVPVTFDTVFRRLDDQSINLRIRIHRFDVRYDVVQYSAGLTPEITHVPLERLADLYPLGDRQLYRVRTHGAPVLVGFLSSLGRPHCPGYALWDMAARRKLPVLRMLEFDQRRSPVEEILPVSSPRETQNKNGRSLLADYYERYRLELLTYLTSRVASPEQAKDLLQQTFLRVLQRKPRTEVTNPRAYLRTVARNVLTDFYRQQASRRADAAVEFAEDDHGSDEGAPDRQLVADEYLHHLANALENLSRPVRVAFVLSRVYGYTYAEVGEALSISPRTVEKHVAKGLATCLRHMNELDTHTGEQKI